MPHTHKAAIIPDRECADLLRPIIPVWVGLPRFFLLILLALSVLFAANARGQDFSPQLAQPYLPTRAVVPTIPQLATLAEGAYQMGLCHDSMRWYSRLRPFNRTLADFGTARCLERLGEYNRALSLLNSLREENTRYQAQVEKLRGHILLLLTEQAQLRGNLTQSEGYLRTFFKDHNNQRHHDRYAYLMRQQATLSNLRNNRTPQTFEQPLRVALLLPLTGRMASVGESMEKAALQALFEQSLPHLELYPEDTKATPDGTLAAFERAMQSGADVVLGPLLGNNVKALAGYARSVGIPVMAFSSDTNALLEENIRLFSILPTEQARRMARYGVEEKGLRTFSALLPDNRYGRVMLKAFKEELSRLGATFDRHAFFTPGSPDLNTSIRYLTRMAQSEKVLNEELELLEEQHALLAGAMDDDDLERLEELKQAEAQPIVNYQALFVPASAQEMPLISSQLAFYDSDGTQLQLLGSSQWDDPALTAESQNYLRGAVYPTTPQGAEKAFRKSYRQSYNTPPHPLAKLSYDSVSLVAHLARHGLSQGSEFEPRLLRLKAFHGATGPYQILQNGTLRHGYSLMRVRNRRRGPDVTEIIKPPYLLPPEIPPLGKYTTKSKRSLTDRPARKSRGFFGGLFGN